MSAPAPLAALPSARVEKEDDLKYDLGRLCAVDAHPLDVDALVAARRAAASAKRTALERASLAELGVALPSEPVDAVLRAHARDNVQLLVNRVWQLPVASERTGVYAELPYGTTAVPRAKPVPKPKPMSRWEKFAKARGIEKKGKRSKFVYDEERDEERRRYGFKGVNQNDDDWIVEAKAGDDPAVDPWLKKDRDRKDRVGKQKQREARNLVESTVPDGKVTRKQAMSSLYNVAKVSSASVGDFDRMARHETAVDRKRGLRYKHEPAIRDDRAAEKRQQELVLESIFDGKQIDVNVSKGVHHMQERADARRHARKHERDGDDGGSKKRSGSKGSASRQKGQRGPRAAPSGSAGAGGKLGKRGPSKLGGKAKRRS